METEKSDALTLSEKREVDERAPPRSAVVYEVVRKAGEDELCRPPASLFWSGLAAGIAIMASVIAEGALTQKLPDAPWREVVADLGYSLGFLIVILGQLQLFTEQTIVTVLPFAAAPGWAKFLTTARLWVLVFVGNMIGAAAAAAINLFCHLQSDELMAAMIQVSGKIAAKTPSEVLLQGIPAGFLIAAVAWIRAAINDGDFWVVLTLTYAIALGGFSHVVAGSAEAFLLLFNGSISFGQATIGIILPALVGNVIGGTGLFALLAHAQVRQEL